MFSNSDPRAARFRVKPKQVKPRDGLASLRLFCNLAGLEAGIYQDRVLGGYRGAVNGEVTIIAASEASATRHLFRLYAKTGVCVEAGVMPQSLQDAFDATEDGSTFHLRDIGYEKLERDALVAAVNAIPVWHLGSLSNALHSEAARIPLSARMLRHSWCAMQDQHVDAHSAGMEESPEAGQEDFFTNRPNG
jgi:hypothetical protein